MDRASVYDLVFKLRKEGMKQTKIAELLSITQARVSQILSKPASIIAKWGGHLQSKLTNSDEKKLIEYLEMGAESFGFEGCVWNSKRVQSLIKEQFGVDYHVAYIPCILRKIGFSRQKPKVVDYRQEEAKVAIYLEETLPSLKKKAIEEDRVLLYVDEAGFYLLPKLGTTWAKRGQTPLLHEGCRYQHLSAISAISPAGDLVYQIQENNYKGENVVNFLKILLKTFNKKLLIIWDGARIHADENVKSFLRQDKEESVFLAKIPPYSPELNADEQVWKALKSDMLKNVVCKNLAQLKIKLQNAFQELQKCTDKIAHFFKHPKVGFI